MGALGMSKHRKSGHPVNSSHFTGPQAGKKVRRKGSTRGERALKHGTHKNKYAKLAPKIDPPALAFGLANQLVLDRIQHIKLKGRWMDTWKKGKKIQHEGKTYRLCENVTFPQSGEIIAQCRLVKMPETQAHT